MPWDKISATELQIKKKKNLLASNNLAGSKDNVFWKTRLGDSEVSLNDKDIVSKMLRESLNKTAFRNGSVWTKA